MLRYARQRLKDMATIRDLCLGAERHAAREGQVAPGAEHFLLAALDLPDGTARRAFEQAGVDPDGLGEAIARQYADALRTVGVDQRLADSLAADRPPAPTCAGLYQANPTGQDVMKALATHRRDASGLRSAQVVAVVAAQPAGVAVRALRAMGVEPEALRAAAERTLDDLA